MAAVLNPRISTIRPPAAPARAGAVVAIGLHVAAAALLLSYEPARTALLTAAPIMVELLVPPPPPLPPVQEPRPQPKIVKPIEPPKPKPVAKAPPKPVAPQPVAPQPVIAAPETAPSPVAVPAQPAAPAASVPAEAPAASAGGGASGLATSEPIFNADYLENPAPAYPPISRRSGEQGKVMLRVLVSPAGRADDVQVRTSSGSPRLDEAARATVLRWKFVPAKRGGEAVSAWVLIPISFRLEG